MTFRLCLVTEICKERYAIMIVFALLKHRKFWIVSDFASIGKIYIFPLYVACSDMGNFL